MKVSIVIPAYNEEEFIARTITAVLAQDYPSFEVIVVNNNSTDRTKEIARQFPVTVVDEPRTGILYARECGRQHATGDIIANIDADCLPKPDWLSRGIIHFTEERVVGVSGPYWYYDLGPIARYFFLLTFQIFSRLMNTIMQLSFINRGGVLVGGNTLIRASVMEKTHGYDTSIEFYGEDTNTAKRISKFGHIYFDPRLIMPTSGRRFVREGFLTISYKYFISFFSARQ